MKRWLTFWLGLTAAAAWAAAPSIVTPPANLEVPAGCPATFLVTASGDAPLAYQWWLGGEAVAAGTVSRYTFTTTEITGEPADYYAVVTNASGSVTSAVATISVVAAADCPVMGVPKVRLGGQNVSLMVKAERFLPLVLARSVEGLVAGITNDAQAGAARAMMHPLTRPLSSLSVSSNVVYSNSWFLKDIRNVTGGSLGQWGSDLAAASNCAGNSHYCCGTTNGWGIYQVPCVLVNRRFTVSPGHTGKWNGTNCYEKWVGTNGVAYFINSLASVDFDGYPCQNGSLPAHILQQALDLGYQTNVGYPLLLDGKITLLASDVPDDVESAVLWPTNLPDYTTTSDRTYLWPRMQTGQEAEWGIASSTAMVGGITQEYIPVQFHEELDFNNVPHYDFGGGSGGNSGSPTYDLLGNQAVLSYKYAYTYYRPLFEAAMMYLWTNNGGTVETCPTLTEVDLSGYARLR